MLAWNTWDKTIPPFEINKDLTYAEVIVPTTDSIRVEHVLCKLLKHNKHALIVGETGTGKSITIQSALKSEFDNQDFMYMTLAFSA